jgi:Putative porin
MKPTQSLNILAITALASTVLSASAQTPPAEALINKLVAKGVLTDSEAKELLTDTTTTNQVSASKWKMSDSIKSIGLYGDVRLRYEYRGADNAPGGSESTYQRERFRYAVRLGLRGDLFDNFYYGLRVETSSNARSPWVTFGDDSNATPSAKNSDSIGIGQVYLGWRPANWMELTVGKMPMPLYVTPMIWDSDINPEGAAEKFKYSVGDVDLFATFGQFLYQDSNPDNSFPSSDTFLLAWQMGANVKLAKDLSLKVAPVLYTYTGQGQNNGLNHPFSGQGLNGLNPNTSGYNQNGINDLLVLETPTELNFHVGQHKARVFGDFAYNFSGDNRARGAAAATAPEGGLPYAVTGQNKAYQVGVGYGNLGLVYGQTSKKNTWEARVYWQHIEQYAADVNLLDSDFFEGRANLEGVYAAFAYSFTDSIIGTVRYGYAQPINNQLGTGGNNPDLPTLNPIKDYNLFQLDLTWRF